MFDRSKTQFFNSVKNMLAREKDIPQLSVQGKAILENISENSPTITDADLAILQKETHPKMKDLLTDYHRYVAENMQDVLAELNNNPTSVKKK